MHAAGEVLVLADPIDFCGEGIEDESHLVIDFKSDVA